MVRTPVEYGLIRGHSCQASGVVVVIVLAVLAPFSFADRVLSFRKETPAVNNCTVRVRVRLFRVAVARHEIRQPRLWGGCDKLVVGTCGRNRRRPRGTRVQFAGASVARHVGLV